MEAHSTRLVIQLAIIIICAKLCGYLFRRFLRLPKVLGELSAGIVIGPYALGSLPILFGKPLFYPPIDGVVLSPELYAISSIAVITLLFLAGLETDASQFIRFSGVATVVALGGFIVSFFLGAGAAMLMLSQVSDIFHPTALFFGVIATATSVSITARILTERRKMATSEAATILAAAVLDDVLGIIALAIVVGIARMEHTALDWRALGIITAKAFGFWIGCTLIGFLLAPRMVKGLKQLHSFEVVAGISFGIALLLAGISESVGLAMIIGAYVTGLSLSQTDIVNELKERLNGLYLFLVPVFFTSMGMLVDLSQMNRNILLFAGIYTVACIAGKMLGCGVTSLFSKFNMRGALRIGVGMIPRGEVTLIIAGTGLVTGVLSQELFGVSLFLLLVSSLLSPPLISRLFDGGSGYKGTLKAPENLVHIELALASPTLVRFLVERIVETFRSEEFFVNRLDRDARLYQIRKDAVLVTLEWNAEALVLTTDQKNNQLVRLIVLEDILALREVLEGIEKSQATSYSKSLLGGFFKE